jgi:hypothetical protein
MDSRLWPCTPCGEITEFVQPPCGDGHTADGGECPEWACADCGAAVVIGEPARDADVVRTRIAA